MSRQAVLMVLQSWSSTPPDVQTDIEDHLILHYDGDAYPAAWVLAAAHSGEHGNHDQELDMIAIAKRFPTVQRDQVPELEEECERLNTAYSRSQDVRVALEASESGTITEMSPPEMKRA